MLRLRLHKIGRVLPALAIMIIIHKIIGVVLWIIFIGIVGMMFYSCYWLGNTMCGNYIHEEYPSPSGKWKAVVFQRDCGATTGFSTQISILPSSDSLENDSGNIFIMDGHPSDVAPSLNWVADSELKINRKRTGSEHKAERSYGWFSTVKISYE